MEHSSVTIDGVRILHFPSEDARTTTASLIFAVGARDESLTRFGSLHALEHLCMNAVRDTALDINASVDRLTTQFNVHGRTDLVGPWLTRLCEALAEPPVDELQREVPILIAEGDGIGSPADSLHLVRFGNQDLGLGIAPRPSPRTLSPERLAAHAERWFVAGNAVLVVEGLLPDLKLPLPAGAPPQHDWALPEHFDRPTVVTLDAGCVGVSMLLPPPDAAGMDRLASRLLDNRLVEAIRHERGLGYHVDSEGWPTRDHGTVLTAWAEPGRGDDEAASLVLLDSVTALLTVGPSESELEKAREQVSTAHRSRDGHVAECVRTVMSELFFGSADEGLQMNLLESITVNTMTGYLRQQSKDLLYLLAEEAEQVVDGRGFPRRGLEPVQDQLPAGGTVHRPPLAARMISAEARTVRLVTTTDAVWLQVGGEVTCVRWQDAVGLLDDQDSGMTVVYSLDGTAIAVDSRLSGSERAISEMKSRIPATLWYTNEPETDAARQGDRYSH